MSASRVAWLLSFLPSAEASGARRHRARTLVIHILSGSECSYTDLEEQGEGRKVKHNGMN